MAQPGSRPMPMGVPPLQPGQQPTQQQVQAMQAQFYAEAARRGLTPQQFGEQLKAQAMQQQQQAQQQQQGGQGHQQQQQQQRQGQQGQQMQMQMPANGQQVPIQPGPPKPEAIALAKFLLGQPLKSRTCIFNGQRKEMFKVKRAIRALNSTAYTKARSKQSSLLPEITDRASAEQVFKSLPISMLALRVSKLAPGENPAHGQPGHVHAADSSSSSSKKQKNGKKGLWNVKIEPQQDAQDEYHYIWLYEGSQWKQKLYAGGALTVVLALVLFPLWPYTLRKGVWYLSMACLGLLAAFFGLAIVRLIIFLVTIVAGPQPGIWIYPNLFEDVGFFDSFRPGWAWRETKESTALAKKAKKEKKLAKKNKRAGITTADASAAPTARDASTNGSTPKSKVTPKDAPIASKTGATGVAANEGIAAGISTVSERKARRAVVEDVTDE